MHDTIDGQVLYLGRWVPRDSFRAFVYNSGDKKLCNSYDEYQLSVSSGQWFAEPVIESNQTCEVTNLKNVVSIKKRGRKCRSQVKV